MNVAGRAGSGGGVDEGDSEAEDEAEETVGGADDGDDIVVELDAGTEKPAGVSLMNNIPRAAAHQSNHIKGG